MATNDALARAIEYLGAVEVAPGKYVVAQGLDRRNWVVPARALETWWNRYHYALGEPTDSCPPPVTAVCLYTDELPVLMPAWWSPEQRFATVYDDPALDPEPTPYATLAEARSATVRTGIRHAITASLETGEEVPA